MQDFDPPDDAAWGSPADPLAGVHDEGNGVADLRAARDQLAAGANDAALAAMERARAAGLPAEILPLAAALDGLARIRTGDVAHAAGELADAWRSYPDFAALPALLGAAQNLTGEHQAACRSLFAALMGEDPDDSLAQIRPLATALLPSL